MHSRELARETVQCSKCCEVSTEMSVWQAVVFLELEEGKHDREGRVYLIRFIAGLPLRLVYGMRD